MNSTGKIDVVIADDSPLVRERLGNMLSEDPNINIVGLARDSLEALSFVEYKKPDAVVLDIRMPGANGIEVLKKIKKMSPSTVVIILTNYPGSQYKTMCYKSGVDYFFDKS
ncbi:MAG TPA: response regulator transcription factor, partial [Ignavibacteriales bacterium]|nr:response regulator transcription factor [Ignavibacteriales bacterium]